MVGAEPVSFRESNRMETFIGMLAFLMMVAMLYCFIRHGIYPAIRFVIRIIAAVVRFAPGKLRQRGRGMLPVQRVEVRRLINSRDSRSQF